MKSELERILLDDDQRKWERRQQEQRAEREADIARLIAAFDAYAALKDALTHAPSNEREGAEAALKVSEARAVALIDDALSKLPPESPHYSRPHRGEAIGALKEYAGFKLEVQQAQAAYDAAVASGVRADIRDAKHELKRAADWFATEQNNVEGPRGWLADLFPIPHFEPSPIAKAEAADFIERIQRRFPPRDD